MGGLHAVVACGLRMLSPWISNLYFYGIMFTPYTDIRYTYVHNYNATTPAVRLGGLAPVLPLMLLSVVASSVIWPCGVIFVR